MRDLRSFYIDILNDFNINIDLCEKEVMILETVCFTLEKIQKITTQNGCMKFISNSKYAFDYEGKRILNMFLDFNNNLVNPISYYGIDNIKNSNLVKLIKEFIKEEFDGNINYSNKTKSEIKDMNDIITMVVGKVQSEVYLNYVEGMISFVSNGVKIINPFFNTIRNKKINPYYEYNDYNSKHNEFNNLLMHHYVDYNSEDIEYEDIELSKHMQKDIIMYMVNNNYSRSDIMFDKSDLISFFVHRYSHKVENARRYLVSFVDHLQDDQRFYDRNAFHNLEGKMSLPDILYQLFYYIYIEKYGEYSVMDESNEELFKTKIVSNYEIRKIFFECVENTVNGYDMKDTKRLIYA